MKIIVSILLGFMFLNSAELKHTGCDLSQVGEFNVNFEAYKTAAKIGVKGSFDKVDYKAVRATGKNFREIFIGSTVDIETSSVNSKDEERDSKLISFFFNQMDNKNIKAKILDITSDKRIKGKPRTGTLLVEVTMNSVTKKVPMNYIYNKGLFNANGVIDIFDFSANKALNSINKACYDLHGGKTWSDVKIRFSTKIEAVLCSAK